MRGTDLSIIKESFELFNSSNSSYSISSHRAMAKNERRSMSDPSEVMGGSDLRCLKPQSQKFQSRELEIAFEHKSAQWELFYHVIQNSIWDLSRSKEKKRKNQIKKPQLDHEHRERKEWRREVKHTKSRKDEKSEQLFKFDFAEIETFF